MAKETKKKSIEQEVIVEKPIEKKTNEKKTSSKKETKEKSPENEEPQIHIHSKNDKIEEISLHKTYEEVDPEVMQKTCLFEISWEVCNQVGGIYTVIRSKVPSVIKKWGGDNYFLIGPYFANQVAAFFDPITDEFDPMNIVVDNMRKMGFEVHYGTWLITGRPKVILFNPFTMYTRLGEIKFELWDHHRISTPNDDDLINQVVSFGYQVKEFMKLINESSFAMNPIVAHFHEWMAGTPIPELRRLKSKVRIVFTTHATLLGRYLAMNDTNFYNNLKYYNWSKEAHHFNIESQVAIERASAHGAHVLSTVSDVTALECVQLLGRKPESILPNGLNIVRYEVLHRVQILHQEQKDKINEFVMGHFFNSYSFDLNNTLYFFTSGRYEYHNKGYDLTLEALARLNWKMKEAKIDKTVVAFFITKRPTYSLNPEVLQLRAQMEEIRRIAEDIQDQVGKKLYYSVTSAEGDFKIPDLNGLVDEYNKLRLRRNVQSWKSKMQPTIVTHNLVDDGKDEILNFCRTANLLNSKWDKVKIVYHPDFLSASNPLFRMEYTQFVRGCHLGLFPSYYEPWGNTPVESLASGVPSVTSDLSGFGDYVLKNIPDHNEKGMYVVHRREKSFWESAEELANIMFEFTKLSLRDRIALRNKCEEASPHFDWGNLGKYYDKAYNRVMDAPI